MQASKGKIFPRIRLRQHKKTFHFTHLADVARPCSKSLRSPSPWTSVIQLCAVCVVGRHLRCQHSVTVPRDSCQRSAPPFDCGTSVSSAPMPIVVQPAPSASESNVQQQNTTTLNTEAITTFIKNEIMNETQETMLKEGEKIEMK